MPLTVIPVYVDTIRRFPSPGILASARVSQVARVLRPLGLAWRAGNIHQTARVLTKRFGERVPEEYVELIELPGVGGYVASTVRCFPFDLPMPIVDTNTVRVVGRYFGFPTNPESRRSPRVRNAVVAVTSRRRTMSTT